MLHRAVDGNIILKLLLPIWLTMMWTDRTYPSLGFCGDRKEYLYFEQLYVYWLNRSFWITTLVYKNAHIYIWNECYMHHVMKWRSWWLLFYDSFGWGWHNVECGIYLNLKVNTHLAIGRTVSKEENHCYRILVMMLSTAVHYRKRQNGSDYSVLFTWHT
jgi:hypothetical protein